MRERVFSRPESNAPIAIEVDGEPLGVVVPRERGYYFLAVRLPAFALDGRMFNSVEEAQHVVHATVCGTT